MKTQKISMANYEKLAHNAHDAIAIIMGRDGRHVFVNKRMAELSGYSHADLLKMSFKEVVHPDELGKINQRYLKRMAGNKVANRFETKLVDKQGKAVAVEISDSMTDWQGQPAVLAIIRNISERKKGEEEQKKIRAELERLVEEHTLELVAAAAARERKHQELIHHKSKLENANQELMDTNKALTTLARNIDREREDAEKKILQIVRSRVRPILEEFRSNPSFAKYRLEIDELMRSLSDLTPGLKDSADIILSLSSMELRIAALIKNGLTSSEIANSLHLALDTIKTHRRNIRKKLRINNSKINLVTFLEIKMG